MESRDVVLDFGSGLCKVGFAGDHTPSLVFPSVFGELSNNNSKIYIGKDAVERRGCMKLQNPIQRGIITDWDQMEQMIRLTFERQLRITDTNEQGVLLSEYPLNSKNDREKLTQIMFETFQVPCMHVTNQAVLSLYASGRTSGLAFESGHGVTCTVPVYEGYALPHASSRFNLAGSDLTDNLVELLNLRGYNLVTSSQIDMVKEIKEKLCHVSLNFESDMKETSLNETIYELTGGGTLSLGNELIQCPETLFQPNLNETPGIHLSIFNSIEKCDNEFQKELFSQIIISGGTTNLSGIAERLEMEITKLTSHRVKILAPLGRENSVWLGGSILSALSSFKTHWISSGEYEEVGKSIVGRKCF